jgi:hypothetical protein
MRELEIYWASLTFSYEYTSRFYFCLFVIFISVAAKSITYMNSYVQLANTEEYIDGQFTGNLGEILIR